MRAGIIFDIKKFALHDGPGIRTTVFFKGCPLNCQWCHNPESHNRTPETVCVKIRRNNSGDSSVTKDERFGYEATTEDVISEIKKDMVFYEQSGGGVTFSGGEPLLQTEFLKELLIECRKLRIHTAVDTSGYTPFDDISEIRDLTDMFLYDIKIMDEKLHKKYVGVSNRLILDNLNQLAESGANIIPRIPLIPGITDTKENLESTAEYLSSIKNIHKISLLPYNKLAEDKREKFNMNLELGKMKTQSGSFLKDITNIFTIRGFSVSVGG